jgi:serine/threonine protein kinase/formylglycine-generating enzyme required for sulfatase activity
MSETPRTPDEDELASRAALDFLALYLSDRAAGRCQPLRSYLDRFPQFEQRIADEWLRLQGRVEGERAMAFPQPATSDPRIPAGYQPLRELGRGGQGTVYLARDERLGRNVALKVFHSELAAFSGPNSLRFQREIAAIAKLDHASLCTIHDAGQTEASSWIAMKYIDGPSLQQQLANARTAGQGLPQRRKDLDAAALCIERLAEGLHQAHAAGIVHRDIKPGNVLLGPDLTPVLVDFGLARSEASAAAAVTLPGTIVGTPSYLAPELLRDATADARSDVWSLGACLFEMLTFERPFVGATVEAELRARATQTVRDVRSANPHVPRDLAVIVATAIASDPGQRYATAADLAADLKRFRNLQPVLARPAGPLLVLRRWTQRNPALSASLGALLGVLAAGLIITLVLLSDTRAALADVRRLSDLKLASDLQARADTLWPLRESRLHGPDGIDAWLGAADEVLARRALHQEALARLAQAPTDAATPWQREQFTAVLAAIDDLAARRERVAHHREFAHTVAERTLIAPATLWNTTIAAIEQSPRYHHLRMRPQLGLIPLGPDPDSGLFEFAHLQSGAVPARDPGTGKLQLGDDSAIVLVLLPEALTTLGCEATAPTDGHPANIDPAAVASEGPSYQIRLDPFFLAKHETTQAQWIRHTGRNPSNYTKDSEIHGPAITGSNPVEQMDWSTANRVLREMDLQVPTEAQWEYAYRAGTSSVFPCGADARSLQGHENLADGDAQRLSEGNNNWSFEPSLHDGNLVHARIGSFLPNAFGLHDMGGNLKEWCADSWENYWDAKPREGDGLRFGRFDKSRVVRGGGYGSNAVHARSGHRTGFPIKIAPGEVGIRAARRIDP